MRGRVVALLVVALLAVVSAGSADQKDITVVNRTGKPITSLFISLVDSGQWDDDVLGVDVLADGESVQVSLSGYGGDQCEFDVLATNQDDDGWLVPDIDLCAVSEVVVTAAHIQAR